MVTFTEQRIKELLKGFLHKRIAVVGDLMVDSYYWGTVTRVSPEAPVPVVDVVSESTRLGGAANVANNIQALGGEPMLIGLIGDDHPGEMFLNILKEQNLNTEGIVQDTSRPTTIKTRVIAHSQHVVRIDNESKAECPERLRHRIVDAVKYNIQNIDGIILEDYNKGVITKDIIHEIIAVARKYNKIVTVDPKYNNFFEYKNVTVFKPNKRETEEAIGKRIRNNDDVIQAGQSLLATLQAENVLLTRGEEGLTLFEKNGEISHMRSLATNVQDVSGAGDTVISTLTMALVGGGTVREAAALSNCAASVVVGAVGIVPIQPDELLTSALHLTNHPQSGL
ncbi:MAG TPA: D-glycero-beta-D-manno-heptose-7-phosphate kinase [Bacteroidetes bacterium]|nr:D-glycero-beta-D-manno-heptose-7-phosphate kinase [Bacteroidota bacterium]